MSRFSQRFTRDVGSAFDGTFDSGGREFNRLLAGYGPEMGDGLSMHARRFNRGRPDESDPRFHGFGIISESGGVDSLTFDSKGRALIASIDMQNLLLNAGGDPAKLTDPSTGKPDGLWGTNSSSEAARIALKLGFKRYPNPFAFDWYAIRTMVRIYPPDFVRKLQQLWDQNHPSVQDTPAVDLISYPKPDMRLLLCLLSGTSQDGREDAAYRAQARSMSLPVASFGVSNDGMKFIVGPAATLSAMIESAKSKTDLIEKDAKEVNAVIFVLMGVSSGIMLNGAPREDLTQTSIDKYKQLFSANKCPSKCGLPAIQSKNSSNKIAIVGKTCWDLLRKKATEKIDADAAKMRADEAKRAEDALYDKPVSAKDLEKWIRDCGDPDLKVDGIWVNDDLKALRGVFEGADTSQIKTRTSRNRTGVSVMPKGTVAKVKKCAADENERRRKEAAERKRLDDLARKKRAEAQREKDAAKRRRLEEEARLADEERKRKEAEAAERRRKRKAAQDAANKADVLPKDNEPSANEPGDIPGGKPTNGSSANSESGGSSTATTVGLLAGLAGLGLVLFAAQTKK